MFRQLLTRVGLPTVIAAAFLTAGPAWAQHGGGHGGGGHGGGFHGGSFHGGGFHGGGFHSGSFHHGSFHNDGFHRFHDGRFHGGGYYPGYYYGYYPSNGYYASDGYYPSGGYYQSPSYYPSYDQGYGSVPVIPDMATDQPDTTAHVSVKVPADGEVWFDGSPTTSTGSVREFTSPPLTPGHYTYEVRAHWTEKGHDVTQTQKVAVSPGAHITVDFPMSPAPTQTQKAG